jgi:hypothetical protein
MCSEIGNKLRRIAGVLVEKRMNSFGSAPDPRSVRRNPWSENQPIERKTLVSFDRLV